MTNKYKISDLAKDFNMKSKEISDLIYKLTGEEKKSGAVLNEQETISITLPPHGAVIFEKKRSSAK